MQKTVFGTGDTGAIPLDESTIAEELSGLGFRTMMVGKWHVGCARWENTPTGRGFDRYYGFMCR